MESSNQSTVSVGNWFVTILLMAIPIVNIILLFVWAFGRDTPESKANLVKASLIWFAIAIVFYVLFALIIGVGASSMFSGY